MKTRKLLNGQKVSESPVSIRMTIDSKCPKKWLFVDMETGDVWMHKARLRKPEMANGTFYRADDKAILALARILTPRYEWNTIKEKKCTL